MQIINRTKEIRKVTNQQDSAPVSDQRFRGRQLNRGLALSLSLLSLVSVLSPALSPAAFAADEVKAVDSSKSESSKSESGNTETSKAETGKSESSKAVEVKEIKKVEKPSHFFAFLQLGNGNFKITFSKSFSASISKILVSTC